jgi:superfamily I DNA and/or RNA helicase
MNARCVRNAENKLKKKKLMYIICSSHDVAKILLVCVKHKPTIQPKLITSCYMYVLQLGAK